VFANVLRTTCDSGGTRRHDPEADWLHRANYMRGLDGELPQESPLIGSEANKGGTEGKGGSGEPARPAAQPSAGSSYKERAEGNSQFDYVSPPRSAHRRDQRRIAQEGGEIRAIGVLGSDYYEQLLILRALRKHYRWRFSSPPTWTARLLQEDQISFHAQSPGGLPLRAGAQQVLAGKHAPFRDSYQTSTFFASQLALRCKEGIATEALDRISMLLQCTKSGQGVREADQCRGNRALPSVCAQMPWQRDHHPRVSVRAGRLALLVVDAVLWRRLGAGRALTSVLAPTRSRWTR